MFSVHLRLIFSRNILLDWRCHSSHFMELLLGLSCALFEIPCATNSNKCTNKELILSLPHCTIIIIHKNYSGRTFIILHYKWCTHSYDHELGGFFVNQYLHKNINSLELLHFPLNFLYGISFMQVHKITRDTL